ncbi:MAG: tandem-95 repeat protein, partial [Bacteroidia bacterium]|nr:tandem-95 repeat protein [Bacteroidia bacterium]
FLFGGALNKLYAEGTSTASPTLTNLSSLSILPSQNRGAFLGCPQDNRIYIHINSLNERIYYGFNWRGYASGNNINPTINNVFMRIFNPNGVQVAQVNLPTSGNGFISSYNAAKIGANISGSNPGGYSPLSYTPTMTGEYWIELYQSNDGGNTQMGGTTWSFSPYWDIQVAETNGTRYNGRVHCANWSFNATSSTYFTTNYDDDAAPEIYAWSTDSNVFKINFTEGFRPIAYNVAVTNYGVQNTNNFVVDRKSKNSETYPTLSNGYLLFLNPPDSSIYPNGVLPTNPKLESPILVGCTYPFKIRYTVYGTGDVRLLLDLNGVDGFQPGTKDLVLEQFNVQPGLNTVIWDGKDGLGNNVPSGTSFKLILSYGKGRINVPIYDAEINKNGFIITSISPKYDAAIKLYWDDTNLPNVGAACSVSGDNQNNLTGNGWDNSFVGAISPCHAWNGNGNPNQTIPAPAVSGNDADNLQCNDFGNVRVINTFGWATSAYDSAIVFFGCLQVSGTIWNDKDNSANGGFSNIYTLGEYGTNIQNTLYVSMVDPVTGLVLESVPVNPDGTYTFNAVPPKAEGLQIVLSNTQGIVDSLPPTAIINPKWQNTSPLIRTFNTDTLSITGLDFGVRTQEVEPDINQTIVNIPVNGTVATNDHVIPGSVFTPIGTMANGGTLVMNPDGSYIYTPPADFIGRDSISYVACSPVPTICDTTTLTIIVTPLNSQYTNTVIAQDDYATTPKNTPVTMCLLCNDSDPQGNTISNPTIIANPSHGTVTVNPNGTVVYTPAPGYVGKDVYQYTICDNGVPVACDTAYAYVTITDNPISNNQTYANDDAYVTKINTPVTDNVGLNDTDPQGDNVTFTKVTNPNHGTVILNPDGTFTYTPNNGYTGPDQFIYSKCDDGTPTACDTATVYITIDRPIQSVEPDINQTIVNIPVNGTV